MEQLETSNIYFLKLINFSFLLVVLYDVALSSLLSFFLEISFVDSIVWFCML
jgi:hypothetical protein